MYDVTHSSHYSLSLFTQLNNSTLQGLRGVSVTDYLDYDEDYYAPGYYVKDYELFGEEPLDVDFFDEDLDSDMELYFNPRSGGGFMHPQHYHDGQMNRAFHQLQNNGIISGKVASSLSPKDIRSVIRAAGDRVSDARQLKSGDIVIAPSSRRTMGPRRGATFPHPY